MTVTADKQMDRPIHSLIWAAAQLIKRVQQWAKMESEQPGILDEPGIKPIVKTDEEMRLAYMVALRLRAKEVCLYARQCGIKNVTPEQVFANPFLIACAIDHHINTQGGR